MKFKDWMINEVFDTSITLSDPEIDNKKWHGKWTSTFSVNNYNYKFEAVESSPKHGWKIDFYLMSENGGKRTKQQHINDLKISFGVFSAINKATEQFIRDINPDSFFFMASEKEESRVRLYNKFAKRLTQSFRYSSNISSANNYKFFYFNKLDTL